MREIDFESLYEKLDSGQFTQVLKLIDDIDYSKLTENVKLNLDLVRLQIYVHRMKIIEGMTLLDLIQKREYQPTPIQILRIKNKLVFFFLHRGSQERALRESEVAKNIISNFTGENRIEYVKDIIEHKAVISLYYNRIGNFEDAMGNLKEALVLAIDSGSNTLVYKVKSYMVDNLNLQGKFENAREMVEELLVCAKENENEYQKGMAYIQYGETYLQSGQFDQAINYLELAEITNEELNIPELTWQINNTKSWAYLYEGDVGISKTINKKNVEIATRLDSQFLKSMVYNSLGSNYHSEGNLDLSLEYYFLSLDIIEEIGDPVRRSASYNNIALNYKLKGEIDKALDFLLRALEINKIIGELQKMSTTYVNLGVIYHLKGDFENAEKYYLESLQIDEDIGNELYISETQYNLANLYVESKNITKAEIYLEKLEQLGGRHSNQLINLRYLLIKALLLKQSNRSIKKAKSQEIYQSIVESEPLDFELYVNAMFHLCDLLILELKQTGEAEVLVEIKQLLERLSHYANQQQSFSFLAESYLVKSKLALVELELTKAQSLLIKAETISKTKGLEKLSLKISAYYDELLDQINVFENLMNNEAGIKERIESAHLEDYFSHMLRTRADFIEDEPEVPYLFLILNQGGVTLYKKTFNDHLQTSEELIAGLFSAFHTLSDEIFQQSNQPSMQRIRHGEFTILIHPAKDLLFSYVFKGRSYRATIKLEKIIESINQSDVVWDALLREVPFLTNSEKKGMDLMITGIVRE